MQFLTYDDVLHIHNVLADDFRTSRDPIEPSGVRQGGALLHSAVLRQQVGFEGELKYKRPVENAVTLTYGVCCNHPFHNGNKRTALVSMLCHLDRNGMTLRETVDQEELYKFMIRMASHRLDPRRPKR